MKWMASGAHLSANCTVGNKITGLHQMAGQGVKLTIGKFWIYYSEQQIAKI
jgi:hypothetical protein